jgi:hypothetical protein
MPCCRALRAEQVLQHRRELRRTVEEVGELVKDDDDRFGGVLTQCQQRLHRLFPGGKVDPYPASGKRSIRLRQTLSVLRGGLLECAEIEATVRIRERFEQERLALPAAAVNQAECRTSAGSGDEAVEGMPFAVPVEDVLRLRPPEVVPG